MNKYTLRCNEDGVTEIISAEDMDAAKERAGKWMREGEWGDDGANVGVTVEFRGPPRLVAADDGDIEVHTTQGWGYLTTDSETGLATSYWSEKAGGGGLATLAENVSACAAMTALIAAVPADAEHTEIIEEEYLEIDIEPDHAGKIAAAGGDVCGTDPDDHDWTSAGEGGLKENPGVWSKGGTVMTFDSHCRRCGLHRHAHCLGSQRNDGQHDTITYEMLDSETIARHRENGDMDEAAETEND